MNITEALVAEHRTFLAVFDQIERLLPGMTTLKEVRSMATLIQGMLEKHSKSETELAFLALDHVLAEHGRLDRMHTDHKEIDESLLQVHQVRGLPDAKKKLDQALAAAREHFKLEEKSVFPMLERTLDKQTLVSLGTKWQEHHATEPAH